MAGRLKVLVADGEALFLAGMERLLSEQPRLHVVGATTDGDELMLLAERERPHVVMLDLNLRGMGGADAIRRLAVTHPRVRVLVLTRAEDPVSVLGALRAGASGFVLKSAAPRAVAAAVELVSKGGNVFSAAVITLLLTMVSQRQPSLAERDGLTQREMDVLKLVAVGVNYKQVASQLKIGHKTVRNYMCHIYDKLDLQDHAQVALYAVQKGLVMPSGAGSSGQIGVGNI